MRGEERRGRHKIREQEVGGEKTLCCMFSRKRESGGRRMMWSRWGHKSAYTSSSSCQSRGGGGCEANYTLAWRSRLRRTSFRLHQPVECQADNSSCLLDLVANKDHFRILAPIRVWEGGGRERRMRSKNPFLPLLRLFMSPVRHLPADPPAYANLRGGGGSRARSRSEKPGQSTTCNTSVY